jgi:hypothetical protein
VLWYCKDSLASASDSRAKSSSSGSRKTLLNTRVFIFPRSILDELVVEKRARVSCHNCKECLEKDLSIYFSISNSFSLIPSLFCREIRERSCQTARREWRVF